MAKARTVPVRLIIFPVERWRWRGGFQFTEGLETLHLPAETQVIVGWPWHLALAQIDLRPFTDRHPKVWVPEGRLAPHYEVRVALNAVTSGGGAHPQRGRLLGRVSPQKIWGLPAGKPVIFQKDGMWEAGVIQEYTDPRVAQEALERDKKKAKIRERRYQRQPTIWDRLSVDGSEPPV